MTSIRRHLWQRLLAALVLAALSISIPISVAPAAAAPLGLNQAFGDTPGVSADFDLLGALRLLQGDQGLGGSVRPRDNVTRAEFTALVLRLGGLAEHAAGFAAQPPPFSDANAIPTWAWGYVGAARHYGLIRGYEDGTFRPDNPVRLAEALAMLARLLDRQDEAQVQLGWPETFLELGERTGLSGIYSGYADLTLDRAGLAHLAAQALTVEFGSGGPGQTLLASRYGFVRGRLDGLVADRLTIDGMSVPLADPYLWLGGRPAELVGQVVDILRLPDGRIAYVCPAGAAYWSPDGHLGYLSAQTAPRLHAMPTWWDGYLAAESQLASGQRAPGQLTSGRVSLALPAAAQAEAFGFVRVKGTTTGEGLLIRTAPGEFAMEIAVSADGAFDQRVYLPTSRGMQQLELLTPVPGREGWVYSDHLSFAVDNRLTLAHDHLSGATLLWPRGAVIEAPGYVDVLLSSVPGDYVFLRVEYADEHQMLRLPIVNGRLTSRIWLTRGPGQYDIQLCMPVGQDGYYLTKVGFAAVNTSAAYTEWLAPGTYILSGHPEVRTMAMDIAGHLADPYAQALAVYRWLGRNIAYDVARAGEVGTARPMDTLAILARGEGVCEDYANVFAAMCRALSIPARIVTGLAPLTGGELHAWNEFWAGDRWVELDATWGAGYVQKGLFVRQPLDDWFDRDLSGTHRRTGLLRDWRATNSQ